MKRRWTTILTAAVVLAVLGYTAYQVAENLTRQIQTVDALEVTVEDKIPVRGWFVRQQTLVVSDLAGTAEYLVSDGEKVSKGESIAVFFSGEDARQDFDRARVLQEQLEAVEYAYAMITSGADSLKIDQLIFDDMTHISAALAAGEPARVGGEYAAMQQLIVSRGGDAADREAFEQRIAELKKEISACQGRYASGSSRLRAPVSGYFAGGTDGYETVLTAEGLQALTPDALERLEPAAVEGVGSVTTGFRWYFVTALSAGEAAKLQQRESLRIAFPGLVQGGLEMKVVRLQTYDDGRAILILESDRMWPEYLTAREQDADLVAGTYTGLKVPTAALRHNEGQWGVYVLEGSVVTFKPAKWIYQTESYYLVPSAETVKGGLYRYDKIIIQGSGLENNQIIGKR